ncbi:tetratricopeptide repeat protein [bacterium 0.1xD8-71]|nr:tetratricopeptide repeat protein [bacterium 0.1xD8-71]
MSERTREPDRERRASGGSQTAKKKKKPVSAGSAGNRQRPAAKKSGTSSHKRAGTTSGRTRRPSERARMEEDSRMSNRDIERARRRQERLRRVRRQKIIMASSVTVIVLCLLTILIIFLSPARCIVSLSKGDRYARNEEYDKALEAYQEALETNENSVQAYRGIAGCLRMKEQIPEAEQILYTGWEKTKDEGILRYYHKLLINDAVTDINAGNCSQTTMDKLNQVLMNDPQNQDALSLRDICNERLSGEAPQTGEEEEQP